MNCWDILTTGSLEPGAHIFQQWVLQLLRPMILHGNGIAVYLTCY